MQFLYVLSSISLLLGATSAQALPTYITCATTLSTVTATSCASTTLDETTFSSCSPSESVTSEVHCSGVGPAVTAAPAVEKRDEMLCYKGDNGVYCVPNEEKCTTRVESGTTKIACVL